MEAMLDFGALRRKPKETYCSKPKPQTLKPKGPWAQESSNPRVHVPIRYLHLWKELTLGTRKKELLDPFGKPIAEILKTPW